MPKGKGGEVLLWPYQRVAPSLWPKVRVLYVGACDISSSLTFSPRIRLWQACAQEGPFMVQRVLPHVVVVDFEKLMFPFLIRMRRVGLSFSLILLWQKSYPSSWLKKVCFKVGVDDIFYHPICYGELVSAILLLKEMH